MNAHSTSEHSEAYIALGANLGDREHTLIEAIERLDKHPHVDVIRCSNLYETEPVGYLDQPNFVNMAIAVSTRLSPEKLLKVMLQIELDLGRERHIRWGPRTVDLDLLWMDGMNLDTPLLTLPHPRMMERAFVIVPLHDIVSSVDTTELYFKVTELIEAGIGKEGIYLWKTCSWPIA